MSATIRMAQRVVDAPWFNWGVMGIIVLNAIVLGLETSPWLMALAGAWLEGANQFFLGLFILEACVKITAVWPKPSRYFKDGWNAFDFLVIVVCLLPSTGELATLARLVRLLRVLRLVSALPELRLIVATLVRSIPSMFNVLCLMSIIFYIYALAGYHLFHDIDPTHWRSLGISALTLFRVVTLEDWTDVMYAAMNHYWWAWAYFVSFVVLGTFVVVNLFIAVVLNNLDEAKSERLRQLTAPPSREDLLRELRATRDSLARLEERLHGGVAEEPRAAAMPAAADTDKPKA